MKMKSCLFFAVILLTTLMSAKADSVEGKMLWRCAPQELLMGRWAISILEGPAGLTAKTSFLKAIRPGMSPTEQNVEIKSSPIESGVEYTGDGFQIEVYPSKKPKRNPFYQNTTAVSARVVKVKFSSTAELSDRSYACIPVSGQNSGIQSK